MKHSDIYRVHYHYTDKNFDLKLFYIAKYMQETALAAFDLLGEPRRELTEKNLAFFVSKITFRFEGEIKKFDTIKVETWTLPPKSVNYVRNYRITNETTGVCAVRAASSWALVNTKDMAIMHPNALSDQFNALSTDTEELGFAPFKRINIPPGEPVFLFDKEVFYCDIDENMHMNNTIYLDIAQNALHKMTRDLPSKKLTALDISYESGAPEGERLSVWGTKAQAGTETELYLRGKIGATNCFTAKAVY